MRNDNYKYDNNKTIMNIKATNISKNFCKLYMKQNDRGLTFGDFEQNSVKILAELFFKCKY